VARSSAEKAWARADVAAEIKMSAVRIVFVMALASQYARMQSERR